jgi:hypothetical protein
MSEIDDVLSSIKTMNETNEKVKAKLREIKDPAVRARSLHEYEPLDAIARMLGTVLTGEEEDDGSKQESPDGSN